MTIVGKLVPNRRRGKQQTKHVRQF